MCVLEAPISQVEVIDIWEFPKIEVPYFGVLLIRILLFRVLTGYHVRVPLFSETPI